MRAEGEEQAATFIKRIGSNTYSKSPSEPLDLFLIRLDINVFQFDIGDSE